MDFPWYKKAGFSLAALTLALLLLDLSSCLLLSAVERRWTTLGQINTLRAFRIEPDAAPLEESGAVNPNIGASVIHPFLGYVPDPVSIPLGNYNPRAHELGFVQNRHDLFQEPSEDKVVVAVTGGSVARGVVVFKQSLRRALEKSPRFAGRKVVVLSLAAGGYKQPQQLMTLSYFLALGAHFDVVVNIDGFNDIVVAPVRVIPDGEFPFFPSHWTFRVGELGLDKRRLVGKLTFLRERRRSTAGFFSQAPWRFSMTAALLWRGLDNVETSRITRTEQSLDVQSQDGGYQAKGPSWIYADDEQMYRDLARVWSRTSYQMHLLSQGYGIEYHHVLQPNQYVPGSKTLTPEEKAKAWRADHRYREPVMQGYPLLIRFGRELREQGVAFHDLTPIFVDHPETLYRDACCHLNDTGNDVFAENIVRALENTP